MMYVCGITDAGQKRLSPWMFVEISKRERRRGYYINNVMGKMLGGVDGHVSVFHRGLCVCC
jgi:hypothetical protein